MKKNTITEAIGGIEDRFIAEAMDYKCERRITINKRKIAVVAAAILLVALAIPATAAAIKHIIQPSVQYYGSLEDGTAVVAPPDSVKISVESVDDITVKFVIDEDDSVYPFNEYTELVITSFALYNYRYDRSFSEHSHKPDPNCFNKWSGSVAVYTDGDETSIVHPVDDLSYSMNINGREMYIRKDSVGGKMAETKTYMLEVKAIYGRNADGDIMEIRGSWIIDFTI